jgi:thiol-disulfide isomerase/thioredoxin
MRPFTQTRSAILLLTLGVTCVSGQAIIRNGTLQPGDVAPDFALESLDGKTKVHLAEERGRPVVLIFGSYTCPPFRDDVPALNRIYRAFKDKAAFHLIYIKEAHPSNGWDQDAKNVRDHVIFADPRTPDERREVASVCVRKLNLLIPAVMDDLHNSTGSAYDAWPDRIYLIGENGKIAYKSGPGPNGFDTRALERALRGK